MASRGSCVTSNRVPLKDASCRASSRRTSARIETSSAESGSSSSSSRGSVASALRSATRCACPPDSERGIAPALSDSPASASHLRALSTAFGRRSERRPKATFSSTVRWGKRTWSWKTRPTRRRSAGTWMPASLSSRTFSSSDTRPCISSRPASARNRVVLPAPFGPSTATVSPPATVKRTSSVKSSRPRR